MSPERASRGEFAQFVTHHVFLNINRNMLATIMNGDGMPNHLREDCAGTRPGAYHDALIGFVQLFNLFEKFGFYKRTLFHTTRHNLLLPLTGETCRADGQ